MIRLDGKVMVVTGGTTGFGLATARLAREIGARVAILARGAERGQRVAAELGDDTAFASVDVANESQVRDAVETIVHRFGRLDVLVNNAGIIRRTAVLDEDLAGWEALMAVNLRGTFLCCKHAMPHLTASRGSIVNVSSTLARGSRAGRSAAYDASKAGVEALTRSMACAYGPQGVRANAVCPGYIQTDLNRDYWASLTAEARAALIDAVPLRRLGAPEDVARAILFFASDAAGWITGASLMVDGGRSAS